MTLRRALRLESNAMGYLFNAIISINHTNGLLLVLWIPLSYFNSKALGEYSLKGGGPKPDHKSPRGCFSRRYKCIS
jgi:hypothetical protein